MMLTQQTEVPTCPTIEPTSREGFRCTKSLRVNLAEGRRAVTKTPKHTGITGESPASHHRARCLHRIPVRLPRFVRCRVGAADRQPTQAYIDPDRQRTRCSREHAEEAVRPNRS